jgi:hypothetical protein
MALASDRRLVLAGFDSSARALHRTLTDTLTVFVFTLADAKFRSDFHAGQDVEQAYAFWKKNLRYGKVMSRLAQIEQDLGMSPEASMHLAASRAESLQRYSTYVHSLFVPAALTAYVPSMAQPGTMQTGVVGHTSFHSVWTLDETAKTLWYFTLISFRLMNRPPQEAGLPTYPFNKRVEVDRMGIVAYHAFHALMLKRWEDADKITVPDEPPRPPRTGKKHSHDRGGGRPKLNSSATALPNQGVAGGRPAPSRARSPGRR